jgi:pilus assembly protein Flp/PilA
MSQPARQPATWRAKIGRFLKSEDGPTAIEYAVLASMIIAVCVLAIGAFGDNTKKSLEQSSKSIAESLQK